KSHCRYTPPYQDLHSQTLKNYWPFASPSFPFVRHYGMQTEQSRLQYLIVQYADNLCTKEEMSELFSLLGDPARDAKFNQEFLKIWNDIHPEEQINSVDENRLFSEIEEKISAPSIRRPRFVWAKAAAVLLLVLGGG